MQEQTVQKMLLYEGVSHSNLAIVIIARLLCEDSAGVF